MTSTPSPITPRISQPNHAGLGRGFRLTGGARYGRRLAFGLDLDFGMARVGYRGRRVVEDSARASTRSRASGSGWCSPRAQSSSWSFQWEDAGLPDCPVVCTPTEASTSARSTIWRHEGSTTTSYEDPGSNAPWQI